MEWVTSQCTSSISRRYTKFRTFCSFSFQHVPPIEWFGRNISEGRTSSILMMMQCYLSITTYSYINFLSISQSIDEIRSEIERDRSMWRGMKSMIDMQRQRIHKECTVSLGLRETYIILVNSTHRLEFWDFSLTLSFSHYQCLQFLVARKLLPILVDDHKIIGKFRLEGTLGGL